MSDDAIRSVADVLRVSAEWLDLADEAFATLAAMNGQSYPPGQDNVQRGLRALAAWFDERPLPSKMAWRAVVAASDVTSETRIEVAE